MSTATARSPIESLEENAQSLIDARLDTIERMLLGQVSRGDRLAIVREVEAQIHDLLAERNPNDTDRDAVIATLARLDPPEAYLPDAIGRPELLNPREPVSAPRRPVASIRVRRPGSTTGKVGGIVGLSSVIEITLAVLVYLVGSSIKFGGPTDPYAGLWEFALVGLLLASLISSIVAIACSTYARFDRSWAIVGLVTGCISITFLVVGTLCLLIR